MQIGWKPYPPSAGIVRSHIVTVLYTEFDDAVPESFEVAGDCYEFLFDIYHGIPIDPDEEFRCALALLALKYVCQCLHVIKCRFDVEAVLEDGSKVRCTQPLIARTLMPEKRATVLRGRFPRVFLSSPILFDQNKVGMFMNYTSTIVFGH